MAAMENKVTLVGASGLVGSHILTTLLAYPSISTTTTLTRSAITPTDPHSRLNSIVSTDTTTWPSSIPSGAVFFSALGTTRRKVGGFEAQRKIDYDLNLELARAAHAAGARICVLISSAGANPSSFFGYPRMKGELEDAVAALGFEQTIILRPGLIVGTRKAEDVRPPEYAIRQVASGMGAISGGRLKDFWAQDADVIGRAAVAAALKALDGSAPEKKWIVGQADVVRLGRTEWKE